MFAESLAPLVLACSNLQHQQSLYLKITPALLISRVEMNLA